MLALAVLAPAAAGTLPWGSVADEVPMGAVYELARVVLYLDPVVVTGMTVAVPVT